MDGPRPRPLWPTVPLRLISRRVSTTMATESITIVRRSRRPDPRAVAISNARLLAISISRRGPTTLRFRSIMPTGRAAGTSMFVSAAHGAGVKSAMLQLPQVAAVVSAVLVVAVALPVAVAQVAVRRAVGAGAGGGGAGAVVVASAAVVAVAVDLAPLAGEPRTAITSA